MHRFGFAVDHDPNSTSPVPFRHNVNDPDYDESWVEGIDIWHHPKAKRPLGLDSENRKHAAGALRDGRSSLLQW